LNSPYEQIDDFSVEKFPLFVGVPEAARITGLPESLLRKSCMREDKRPKNVPPPPPLKRFGRAVYFYRDRLPAWANSLDDSRGAGDRAGKRTRGRPTVTERINRRHMAVN
jgi:hypothetical protein